MDELVKMKTLADKKKLIVIPIFYKVETEDVSNLKGEFGENFYKLAKANPDRMTKWNDALEGICNYMGMLLGEKRYMIHIHSSFCSFSFRRSN